MSTRSALHSIIKNFERLVMGKKADEAKNLLKAIVSKLDKAASKGIIHKNAAARKASRLTKKLSVLFKA